MRGAAFSPVRATDQEPVQDFIIIVFGAVKGTRRAGYGTLAAS